MASGRSSTAARRATRCGPNRIAGDDRELALLALALRPIANPAFPLDAIRPVSSGFEDPPENPAGLHGFSA
jgi:hypothetical protein